MPKYLYAASIQGIQGYIFKTGKLKEIVGASEIVNTITNTIVEIVLGERYDEKQLIRAAAGSIYYLPNDESECQCLVREVPKLVYKMSAEITISQAAVRLDGKMLSIALKEVEQKLKTQRNKNKIVGGFSFMGIERERATGAAILFNSEKTNDKLSESTKLKTGNSSFALTEKFGIPEKRLSLDFSDLVKGGKDQWMAVIHADGNGLGNIIQNLFSQTIEDDGLKTLYRSFSKAIQKGNEKSVKEAYESLGISEDENTKIPIRPIILGGDDLTVVMRADLAYDFTKKYLEVFEQNMEDELSALKEIKGCRLSACAGIAYIKSSYPIYYGLHLAEALCKNAKQMVKKDSKEFIESALAFYKVKESFVDDLDSLIERTMKINPSQNNEVNFYYGPYYLNDRNTRSNSVKNLDRMLKVLDDEETSTSNLRKWIGELYKDRSTANLLMDRMISNSSIIQKLGLESAIDTNNKTIIHDLLTLHSFKN